MKNVKKFKLNFIRCYVSVKNAPTKNYNMKKKIIEEIDRRIKSIERNQKIQRGGYYKVQLSGQICGLKYLRDYIEKLK